MNKEIIFFEQRPVKDRTIFGIVSDMKALVKGLVLISNVLPVFIGFWLALYFNDDRFAAHGSTFLLTIIGSTLVMAGALILNNWWDVDIDRKMARTKNRPTVTGNFQMRVVLAMGIIFSILGFILLFFTTIEATIYAFIGWITYVVLYTMWSKRKYTFHTLIGSVSGAVTPLIGWAAIEPAVHPIPIVLSLILFIWQMPHSFAIGIRYCKEYQAAGVKMLPVVYGLNTTKRQMVFYIICLHPLPFFLPSLGTIFMVVATVMNIGWLYLGISGFFTENYLKWARLNFIYSVNYITLLFLLMVIVTI